MEKKEKKAFIKLLVVTSLPVALQNLLQNSLSFIDTMMIGRLGENAIAAVGLGSQIYFLVSVIFFGICSGMSIFTSQFWGSRDEEGVQHAMGVGLIAGVAIGSVFSALSIFAPGFLISFFLDDPVVVELGTDYLQWVGISYLMVIVSQIFSSTIRSCGDTRSPMVITMVSMFTDVIGNYLLIFVAGLGVKGAAIATMLSRFLEMVLLFIRIMTKCPVRPRLARMFTFKASFFRKMLKVCFPVVLDDGLWALGLTVYKMVYARMGVSVMASVNVTESIQNLFFVLEMGLGAGAGIIIGNEIGRGKVEDVRYEASVSLKITGLVSVFCAALMAVTSPILPKLFSISDELFAVTRASLLALSLTLPIKFINHVAICGVLRSGGDTKFVLFLEIFSIWVIGVPMAYLGGIVFALPIHFVYLMIAAEEVVKVSFILPRISSGKWINRLSA